MSETSPENPVPTPTERVEADASPSLVAPPVFAAVLSDDRLRPACPKCGYDLVGLPIAGLCPECGDGYTAETARRVRPWPGWGWVLGRMGWPFVAVLGLDVLSFLFLTNPLTEGLLLLVQLIVVPALLLVGAIASTHAFVRLWTQYRTVAGEHPSARRLEKLPAAILWLLGYFILAPACWVGGCAVGAAIFG